MKSSNDIEKTLKERIGQDAVNPPEFIWDNIEKDLDEKPKRRLIFFWFAGLMMLLIVVMGIYQFSSDSNGLDGVSQIAVEEQNDQENITSIIEVKDADKKLDPESNQKSNELSLEENLITEKKESQNVNSPESLERELTENRIDQRQINKSYVQNESFNHTVTSGIRTSVTEVDQTELLKDYNVISKATLDSKIDSNAMVSISSIDRQKICLEFSSEVLLNPELESGDKEIKIDDKKKYFGMLSFSLGRHYKAFQDVNQIPLVIARNETESSWYAWGLNINAGYHLNDHVYLLTGLDFVQSKDRFYYEEEIYSRLVTNSFSNQLDTSFMQGSYFSEGEVRHNSINIPLNIGIHQGFKSFDLGLEFGVLFNLKFSATGKVLQSPTIVSNYNDVGTIYKNSLGLGFSFGLVLSKNLSNGLGINCRPKFRMFMNEINDESYDIQTKMNYFLLDIGLKKSF